jgi:hypothetical protein
MLPQAKMDEISIKELVRRIKDNNNPTVKKFQLDILGEDGIKIGSLNPIDNRLASDQGVIDKLTKWRKIFKKSFLTQFIPTPEKTKSWLESVVLPSDDRVLFLIYTDKGKIVGNFGVCDLCENRADLDNLIRGEIGGHPQLIYFAELAMLRWLFRELDIPIVSLHVFSNNYKTISLHESIGFRTIASYCLIKEESEHELRYVMRDTPSTQVASFTYCKMMLTSAEFEKIHNN